MRHVVMGLAVAGLMVIAGGCGAHARHKQMGAAPMGNDNMKMAAQKELQAKPMPGAMMMPKAGPMMMGKGPMSAGGPMMDMLSAVTRMEIKAARELPAEKRVWVLNSLTQRVEMRPSEKEQLIKAIMEVPDVNQREKLLNGLIATENKFIANEQHAWREMAENMQGAKRGCCPMCPRMGKDGMCPMMEDRKCPKMEREGRREREREGMRGHERPEEGKCPKMKDKDEDDDD